MLNLKEKNKIKKILYSWPTLILLFLIILLVGRGVWNVARSEKISRQNKLASEERYQERQTKKANLLTKIKELQTEEGIEAEIREKFRVVKEGEQLAIILESQDNSEEEKTKKESIWTKIWHFFLN